MELFLKKYGRHAAVAAALAITALSSGCGDPVVAKLERKDNSVAREGGALPGAGRASRLLNEQSAFLRRHANDPVEWHPWGNEAFEKAKKDKRPLLVSIGYASCPWSQKMHVESFSVPEVARFMNAHFVCVLVDREERPDVNTSFLHFAFAKQKISGWPLHVWLTPTGLPMYQGIYFPPENAGATPSWRLTLEHVANNWESGRDYVTEQAQRSADVYLTEFRRRWLGPPPDGNPEVGEVKDFLKLDPEAQFKRFMSLPIDKLQLAIADLPTAKLQELWAKIPAETATGLIEKMQPVAAAVLFFKFEGAGREPAFQRFVEGSRNLCYQKLRSVYDPSYGGFGTPPRFAPHQSLDFLVRYARRHHGDRFGKHEEAVEMITVTLDHMLAGGMLDQLGGGFHRYSTDIYWAVPQFEKMIYDQGFMAQTLVSAGQLTGRKSYLDAAANILGYAGRELSHPEGGFYCAEGSSSPAKDGTMAEGVYYVWSQKEIDEAAGEGAALARAVFGIEERGNLPMDSLMRMRLGNTNVLSVKQTPEEAGKALGMDAAAARKLFDETRAKLLEARRKRPRPTLEDKVLTSWNGVAISGFARAGWAMSDAALVQRGERAAEFILNRMRSKDGGLLHAFLDGPSPLPGYSEDYATFVGAMIDLYEATGTVRWLKAAHDLQERQIKDLWDKTDGGFFDGPESPLLFHRMKSMDEASEISAGSTSLLNLVTLSNIFNIPDYRDKARRIVERYGPHSALMPGAFVRFLRAAELLAEPPRLIVVSGAADDPARKALVDALRPVCRPTIPLLYMDGAESEKFLVEKVPDLAPLGAKPGAPAVHFCRGFKSEKSVSSAAELRAHLEAGFGMAPARAEAP